MQTQLDRSNFAVEVHQCFLDLVTGGTASQLFEEADVGAASAFRFTAVPLGELALEEGPEGRPDVTFRRSVLSVERFRARFPKAPVPEAAVQAERSGGPGQVAVVEAVLPDDGGYGYVAFIEPPDGATNAPTAASTASPTVLAQGRFAASPFINFRWMKAPGEAYGRSPVMKALPDIKTANKVVELVLKNATIAVTGIWQADDDGVLNPATVRLVPGSIIPKAVGSAGLSPLAAPGQFDLSERLLVELRGHIRRALLADRLGQVDAPSMTATEVLERAEEVGRVLGATYGRLQSELLTPLIGRALAILRRRGEVPPIVLDGRTVDLQYRSPLASAQAQQEAQQVMVWLRGLAELGPEALQAIDPVRTARWMARAFNVPPDLLRDPAQAPTPPSVLPAPPGVQPAPPSIMPAPAASSQAAVAGGADGDA